MLSREVNHRSKNLLAVVQSIIRYTVSRSPVQQDFVRRINERLRGAERQPGIFIESSWSGVEMSALIQSQLGHVERIPLDRIERKGAPIGAGAHGGAGAWDGAARARDQRRQVRRAVGYRRPRCFLARGKGGGRQHPHRFPAGGGRPRRHRAWNMPGLARPSSSALPASLSAAA